ncbi:MAG TPA: tetratricopeptide repeat protein [Pyrinomonadaceae bacterium]|nr:tetratricopeptide repeat protein [Pyrinomonadaceae bacterium]
MKKIIAISLFSLAFISCSQSQPQPVANTAVSNVTTPSNTMTVTAHSGDPKMGQTPPAAKSEGKTKWTQSGDPIDTKEFDAEIAKTEKELNSKPNDEAAKKALAEAYYKRGFALTEARQYASALGDYRRALKLDPNNEGAKKWIGQIIGIYDSLNKDYPKEGEEPPPLPFKEKT